MIIIDKIIVFGDPCVDYILLKLINMMYIDYKGKKQNENPSIFSNVIAVLFPNTGNISKYKNVHNVYFNGVLNSFSLCMTVGVVSTSCTVIIIVFVGYMSVSWFRSHCQ